MSSQSTTTAPSIISVGMDVHKESITLAVLPATAKTVTRVDKLPNDLSKLKRYFERVRDVVRCRETFQREILKSRHYWCTPHLKWLQHLTTEQSPLAPADRLVFREYHALLQFKLQRRDELDREIERLAELPTLAPMVRRLQCFRGIALQSAMGLATEIVDWRRFQRPTQLAAYHRARVESAAAVASAVHASRVSEAAADRRRRGGARVGGLSVGGDAGGFPGAGGGGARVVLSSLTVLERRAVCGSRCEHSRGRYAPRWTPQNRPLVDTSKPATTPGAPETG